MGRTLKDLNESARYLMDSFPGAVCDNIRIARSRLLEGEAYRGYCASKPRYFYGFRVQVMTTQDGRPVDFCLRAAFRYAGAFVDVTHWQAMPLICPPAAKCTAAADRADSGYTDYEIEDLLAECEQGSLLTIRKSNSKRKDSLSLAYLKNHFRKRIETVFALIKDRLPAHLHAVTAEGFMLKISLFIISLTFDYLTT